MSRSRFDHARAAWLLSLVFAVACDGEAADPSGARVRYSYALLASGSLYRVFAVGPITRGANTTLGLQISYLASSTDPARLERDAEELLRAFGPELLLTPERTLKIEARLSTTDKGFRPTGRTLLYERRDNGWHRAASQPAAAQAKAAGAANPPDESEFPFVRAKVDAAAAAATRWLGLFDQGSPETVEALSREFTRKLMAAPDFMPNLIATRRNLGLPAPRAELYRMQSFDRDHPKRLPGDHVMVQYQATPRGAAPVLERVTMFRLGKKWEVSGYLVQPIALEAVSARSTPQGAERAPEYP